MEGIKKRLSWLLTVMIVTLSVMQPGITVLAANSTKEIGKKELFLEEKGERVATSSNTNKENILENTDKAESCIIATDLNASKDTSSSENEQEGISPYSLLALPEKRAYLFLNSYSEENLKALPVDTILSLLRDGEGNPISVDADAKAVWVHFNYEEREEYHAIGNGETINMSPPYTNSTNYSMEMVVGSGQQLDRGNVRYKITVYISDTIQEYMSYSLYCENESGYKEYVSLGSNDIIYSNFAESDIEGIPVTCVSLVVPSHTDGNTYYFNMRSSIKDNRYDIDVDVYPMKKFLEYYKDGNALSGEVTDEIFSYNEGYKGKFPAFNGLESALNSDNLLCVVYKDVNGKVVAYQGLAVSVSAEEEDKSVFGEMLLYKDGQMKSITKKSGSTEINDDWKIHLASQDNRVTVDCRYIMTNYLSKEYESNAEYYYILKNSNHIRKVVLGDFRTLKQAEAAGAKDITSQVLAADKSKAPYGYKTNYYGIGRFTIFFTDGASVMVHAYTQSLKESSEYDDAPVKGTDPYFSVEGAQGYEPEKIYKVMNSYNNTFDTLYGIGYQTVFIDDSDADLSRIKPVFSSLESVQVYVGEKQTSGVSEQDFSKGPVFYEVHIKDKQKNYNVTFRKKENGPKLFVNGPDKREIFLNEYFENRHDVLIANIGDTDLTGLKAELINASHVKLDNYWNIENGVHTLDAFDNRNSNGYTGSTTGYRDNLAKIRLLPDGEGNIAGTLKISADGQEDVYIELTGIAGNPKIITERLSEGVKFVPYSYVVATNNMHTWNKVTFSIDKGKLPEGLKIYPETGEIYGVPQETGDFPITVKASYSRSEFTPSYKELTLTVQDNTNVNVYNTSDQGYALKQHIGTEVSEGSRDFLLKHTGDQLFVSEGEYDEFVGFWLNGEKLVEGEDYTKESGSTRITLRRQTFEKKAKRGTNTISAEFRKQVNREKELKRTSQNFRLEVSQSSNNITSGGGGGNSSSNTSSSSNDSGSSSSVITYNSKKGYIHVRTGIITKNASGYARWIQDEKGWKLRYANGTMAKGRMTALEDGSSVEQILWEKINGSWYAFGTDEYLKSGWVYDYQLNGWYNVSVENGMQSGWFTDSQDRNTYYLEPQEGKMAVGWKSIDSKWYYFNAAVLGRTWELNEETGNWFYNTKTRSKPFGAMYRDENTPDGYYVNETGEWDGKENK